MPDSDSNQDEAPAEVLQPAGDEQDLRRGARLAWILWGAALLVVAAVVLPMRLVARQSSEGGERARLARAGQAVRQTLDQTLRAELRLMQRAGDDLAATGAPTTAIERRLDTLLGAAPGSQSARLIGADGSVLIRRRLGLVGPSGFGVVTLRLPLTSDRPQFALVLELDLAGEALVPMLEPVLYAPDVVAQLSAGAALASTPLARVPANTPPGPPEGLLRWEQSWPVEGLLQPLHLSLTRDRNIVLEPWRMRTVVAAVFWGAALAISAAMLVVIQRRQRFALQQQHTQAARHALVLQGGGLGFWDLDLPTQHLLVDARARQMLGHPAVQMRMTWDEWRAQIHPEDWPAVQAAHQACLSGEEPQRTLRCRMRHSNGDWHWVVDRGRVLEHDADGRPLRMLGTTTDVSHAVQAQAALRSSEERLRQVVRSARISVFEFDHVAGGIDPNLEDNDVLGWPSGERPTLAHAAQQVHPDDAERVAALTQRSLDPLGDGVFDSQHRILRNDGQMRWVQVRTQTFFEGVGPIRRPTRTVGGITDITDAKLAQERLEQQAALLDLAQDAIVVCSMNGTIAYWNGGATRIYGWTAAEAIGRDAGRLLQQDEAQSQRIRTQVLAVGEHSEVVPERHKDGRVVQMEGQFTLIRDQKGLPAAYFSIKTNVTQRLDLEAQLRQAQRLEAVGQLTGGVAHDFNNLLTVILGNADLLVEQLAGHPPLLRLAEMARSAAQRGAELTHGLLAFARRQPLQPKTVNINDNLAAMQGLLRRTLRGDIELEFVHGAGLWPALIDPAQLESAVLNMVLNARDAMPGSGQITLETANAQIDEAYARQQEDMSPGQYVLVSISDTGSGMNAEQLARAFEPFYTTKGLGQGTGLGLSMVYGFVKQSRGHVRLYSESGKGTTVRMYLPRSQVEAALQPTTDPQLESDYRGTATVLVVEDDPLVRAYAHDVLQSLGYTVLQADNGRAAIAVLGGRTDITLLFTDVIMPGGMDGWELAAAATELRPELKVLFTSGYTQNAIVPQDRLVDEINLLTKPYRKVELERRVWAALQGR